MPLDADVACAADYVETYEAFFIDHPEWRGRLQVEDRESLLECARADARYRVQVDGQSTGFIAARPGSYGTLRGREMVDEILTTPYRGQNLAPAFQRRFLEQLDVTREPVVWGTIEDENLPAELGWKLIKKSSATFDYHLKEETGVFIRSKKVGEGVISVRYKIHEQTVEDTMAVCVLPEGRFTVKVPAGETISYGPKKIGKILKADRLKFNELVIDSGKAARVLLGEKRGAIRIDGREPGEVIFLVLCEGFRKGSKKDKKRVIGFLQVRVVVE